jgi:cbb3-type cytochrome oxidase subunit 3
MTMKLETFRAFDAHRLAVSAGVVLGVVLVAVLVWVFVARRRRTQQYHDAMLLPSVVRMAK